MIEFIEILGVVFIFWLFFGPDIKSLDTKKVVRK